MLFCCYSFAATAYFFRFDKNYIRGCFVQEGADDCTSMRLICDCSCLLFVRWDLNCVVLMFECNRAEWSAIYVFFVCVSASSVSSSHAICVNCVLSSGLEACAMHQCIITYVYIYTHRRKDGIAIIRTRRESRGKALHSQQTQPRVAPEVIGNRGMSCVS